MRKIIIVMSLLSLSLLAQCDLERPMAPFDPPTYNETTGTTYKFNTGADNFDDATRRFLGYEVYYKIELTIDAIAYDISLVDPADLAAHNFKRLYLSTDTWSLSSISPLPNIKTNYGTTSKADTITIDFSTITTVTALSSLSLLIPTAFKPYELRRSVQINNLQHPENGHYRKFSEFMPGDPDIDQYALNGLKRLDTFQVYVAIYVYAFGKSIETQTIWKDITSPLLYLGVNRITVFYNDGLPG